MRTPACFEDRETRNIIDGLCQKNNIDLSLVLELCEVVQRLSGGSRKEGLASEISGCIDAYLSRSKSTRN